MDRLPWVAVMTGYNNDVEIRADVGAFIEELGKMLFDVPAARSPSVVEEAFAVPQIVVTSKARLPHFKIALKSRNMYSSRRCPCGEG
jgi:hypothetical protein